MKRFIMTVGVVAAVAFGFDAPAKADGVKGGAKTWTGRVDARYDKIDEVELVYTRGRATFRVTNVSNAGDIDIKVYDLDNRLITSDRRGDDDAFVTFNVPQENKYRIVIKAVAGNRTLNYRVNTN